MWVTVRFVHPSLQDLLAAQHLGAVLPAAASPHAGASLRQLLGEGAAEWGLLHRPVPCRLLLLADGLASEGQLAVAGAELAAAETAGRCGLLLQAAMQGCLRLVRHMAPLSRGSIDAVAPPVDPAVRSCPCAHVRPHGTGD